MSRLRTCLGAAMALTVQDTTRKPANAAKPSHHPDEPGGRFKNPWPSAQMEGTISTLFRVASVYREMERIPPKDQLPPVRKPDWGIREGSDDRYHRDLKATWLGHACFLVEFPAAADADRGFRVLFDPVFSHRCSPSSYFGPARYTPAPLPVKELPQVDIVVLSHNHYDHTDVHTLKELYNQQESGSLLIFTTLGCGQLFESLGVKREHISELDWWDQRDVTRGKDTLRLVSTPCQHFSGRSGFDALKTLWSSWAVQHKPSESSVWFGGDTGYSTIPMDATPEEAAKLPACPAFKEIGERLGPFNLGLIPIGAYSKNNRFSTMHANPEQAVAIHQDVKAKRSLGMHFGTWQLSSEPIMEPPRRFIAAGKAAGLADGAVGVCGIGETIRIAIGGS